MVRYNWEQKNWPRFRFSIEKLESVLLLFAEKTGLAFGVLEGLDTEGKENLVIDILLAEAIKTSAIEGEFPNRKDVLSSIRKNLGLHVSAGHIKDRSAAGLGEMMIDLRKTFREPLSAEKLFSWHSLLMSENSRVEVGKWRTHTEPMQVISGASGKEKIHFEAPPSARVPAEMKAFIEWFNATAPGGKKEIRQAPVRSAIVHLYFESIHPFEDGNGRIGRALAEKALSQTVGRPVLLSLSRSIEANRKLYYHSLEKAQRNNDISDWVAYFVQCCLDAQTEAVQQIEFTLKKAKFFDRFKPQLNERQWRVVKRMLEEGHPGFEGGMNARKYTGIAKTSKATATRDMQYLLEAGVFVKKGGAGGRSTSYVLNI